MANWVCPTCGCSITDGGVAKDGVTYCCHPCAEGDASKCCCHNAKEHEAHNHQ